MRTSDNKTLSYEYSSKVGYLNNNESQRILYTYNGGYGQKRVYYSSVGSPPPFYFDGTVYSRGSALSSDANYKTNIVDADIAWADVIRNMRIVTYTSDMVRGGDPANPPLELFGFLKFLIQFIFSPEEALALQQKHLVYTLM